MHNGEKLMLSQNLEKKVPTRPQPSQDTEEPENLANVNVAEEE